MAGRDVEVVAPVENSDHNFMKFSLHVNGKLPLKSKTVN